MSRRKNIFKENGVANTQLVKANTALQIYKASTPAEAQAAKEARKLALVMTLEKIKTQYGHTSLVEMMIHESAAFANLLEELQAIKADPDFNDPEFQRLFEDFIFAGAEDGGKVLKAATGAGARNVGEAIARSLYYSDEDFPEEKPGFWQRLFGGG